MNNPSIPPVTNSPNHHLPLPPGSTIGILGGGQLGRMMAMAAAEMGYHVHIFCPEQDCPASEVAQKTTVAAYDDEAAMAAFAKSVDVVTYEFENIPSAPVEKIAALVPVRPSPKVLATSQHRTLEKNALAELGIATAPFAPVNSLEDLKKAVKKIGVPAVLKTATMGYDGKGQWKILSADDLPAIADGEYVLEGFIKFQMEISVIVARSYNGEVACYCPVENIHKNHILDQTIAPARISPELAQKAEAIAKKIAEGFELVGLLAIEMFVTPPSIPPACGGEAGGEILVNETAPRPHNSGHWTMDACVTSQFSQVIRAVVGLPLGNPARLCDARMLNLIGDDVQEWPKYAAMPNAKLHLYGKKEARPGRKMGHVNFLSPADTKSS